MSTPIYHNEASWRAHILLSDQGTRAKLDRVQLRQGHSHTLSPPISGDRKGASP